MTPSIQANEDVPDGHSYSNLTHCDTNNATIIGWRDWDDGEWPADYLIPNKKKYFCYLDRMHNGFQNGPVWQNSGYETYRLNRSLIDSIKGHLRLTTWQANKAIKWFDGLQRSNMGVESEVVAICACAFILHNHDPNRRCHPQMKPEDRDVFFEEVRVDHNVTEKQFSTHYGRVSDRIRNGKMKIEIHDTYETDPRSEQSWRSDPDPTDDGFL